MNAHDTPSGTRMMWNARVNAICARAHGTGFTASSAVVITDGAVTSEASPAHPSHADRARTTAMKATSWSEPAMPASPPLPTVRVGSLPLLRQETRRSTGGHPPGWMKGLRR